MNDDTNFMLTVVAFILAILGFIWYFLWLIKKGKELERKVEEAESEG